MPARTRIKICGITKLEDAKAAADLGVDAIGFVFYPRSPRYIDPEKAGAIAREVSPFVSIVGVFANPTQDEIDRALDLCPIEVIQLHGEETPEFCEAQPRRVIKAIRVRTQEDLKRVVHYPCAVLLDAPAPEGVWGGVGERFDWSLVEAMEDDRPLILAGGLSADNVRDALAIRRWHAVDVSSGVEDAPGVKNHAKMRAFVRAVREFDAAGNTPSA